MRETAPKLLQVCSKSVSFCFKFAPNVPFLLKTSLSACKFRVKTASLSTLPFRFACKFYASSLPSLLFVSLPIRTVGSKFAPYLQVSRQNCFASKFVPNRTVASNFAPLAVSRQNCFASKFVPNRTAASNFALLASFAPKLLFGVSSFKFALLRWFSNLSKNCAACELPFCLNGSCDVASGVSWIAGGGAEVGGRR